MLSRLATLFPPAEQLSPQQRLDSRQEYSQCLKAIQFLENLAAASFVLSGTRDRSSPLTIPSQDDCMNSSQFSYSIYDQTTASFLERDTDSWTVCVEGVCFLRQVSVLAQRAKSDRREKDLIILSQRLDSWWSEVQVKPHTNQNPANAIFLRCIFNRYI